ncbi:hypothetical protein QBC40DRAFT_310194 [Triangularia verruculosa]|uniref:Uncharacterized protein n=1 Tax=Triangularia verruculosa TaxID=2587418 RepID=A0AAN6X9N2_9PEZI|nr:hypothetical protein QBC40DRAFT_310194 [Triangularia verruculosa]
MLKILLTILAYCALTIFAAPPNLQDQPTNVSSDATNLSQGRPHSLDGGSCTWDDTLGDADCGTFTVTFGDGSIWGFKAYTTVRLPNFSTDFILNCSNHGDAWTAVTNTPGLPYIISIHGGNGCISTDFRWEDWDNLWIKYANQWVNVPTDERCSNVFWNGKGRRCVIEIRPADPAPTSVMELPGQR